MWASQDEIVDRFHGGTYAEYDFRIRDTWDNGEFMTGATVDLIERGEVVATETFTASSEDAPTMTSGFWNGRSNHAMTQALSFAWGWIDTRGGIEEALAPFASEVPTAASIRRSLIAPTQWGQD